MRHKKNKSQEILRLGTVVTSLASTTSDLKGWRAGFSGSVVWVGNPIPVSKSHPTRLKDNFLYMQLQLPWGRSRWHSLCSALSLCSRTATSHAVLLTWGYFLSSDGPVQARDSDARCRLIAWSVRGGHGRVWAFYRWPHGTALLSSKRLLPHGHQQHAVRRVLRHKCAHFLSCCYAKHASVFSKNNIYENCFWFNKFR